MKSYLNREEKTQALTLASFIAYTTERSDDWEKIGRSKDSVKSLRMAKSFATRALDTMFEGLNESERVNIMAQVAKMEVVVRYRDEAVREYKRMLELDSVTPVQTVDLMDICEKAVEMCCNCSENPNSCKWRKLFIEYDIPVCDESPEDGKCPYKNNQED
jgi:hypothetical protein